MTLHKLLVCGTFFNSVAHTFGFRIVLFCFHNGHEFLYELLNSLTAFHRVLHKIHGERNTDGVARVDKLPIGRREISVLLHEFVQPRLGPITVK